MKNTKLIYLGAAAIVAFTAMWGLPGGSDQAVVHQAGTFGSVQQGSLLIKVTANGTIKAKNSVQIRSEIEGEGKLSFLIPEGSVVKEGDLLVEMDKTNLLREVETLTMDQIRFESELSVARTELEIQLSDNQSDIQKAQLKVDKAAQEAEKYEQGDAPQELRKLKLEVEKSASEELRAKDKYASMPDLLKEGFVTKDQVEEERIKYETARIAHESAILSLELFNKYTYPMTLREKKVAVEDAQADYQRALKKADSYKQEKEAKVASAELRLREAKDKLDKLKRDLSKMTITAPGAGLVVYGDPDRRWGDEDIKVGAQVWKNQVIMTLPDLSAAQAIVEVHETEITKIKEGLTASVTCDTYPDKIFAGTVTKVAALASSQNRWWDDGAKKFRVEITLAGEEHQLKPGVSAKAEILVDTLHDVTYLAIQGVFVDGDKHFCFVKNGSSLIPTAVKLGVSNDNFIVIESGLQPGTTVALYNPETGEGVSVPEIDKGPKDATATGANFSTASQ